MFLLLLLTVALCMCVWVIIRWRKVKIYWQQLGVPHYTPHPILGSLTFLQRENPAVWMRKVYKEFKSPYVGIWLFWRPALVINSPEIARRVLVKDADVFRNRFASSGKSDPAGALNIITANDPLWSNTRRRLTNVFTAAKLRNLSGITIAKSNNLIFHIKEQIASKEQQDLRNLCTDYTTDVIGESAFGIATNTLVDGDSTMRSVTRDFMKFDLQRGLSWSSIFFFPELVDIFRFSFFPKNTLELLRHIFRTVVAQRGGYDNNIKESRDLLDALVKMKQEAKADGEDMSEDLLLGNAASFLLGGFDTTATTMTMALYELAWNPQYQQRLYEELLAAKEKLSDEDCTSTDLAEIGYLDCIIKETLRLFPPMGWLDRIAGKDYKIDDNLTIPAGTPVYVNGVAMQIDEQYFPEPEKFNPDRFLPENERNIVPYTYMPFGEGPRSCIGMRFGYQTLRHGMTKICLNYEIKSIPGTPKPSDVRVEKNGLFLMPHENLYVQFIPRL